MWNSNGYVGIGTTTTPSYPLEVNGGIKCSSYVSIGTSSPNYCPVVSNSSVKIDYGISSNSNNTGTISLNFTFSSAPYIVAQMVANTAKNSLYVVNISSITTSTFNFRKQYQQGGSSFGSGGEQFYWIAIGV